MRDLVARGKGPVADGAVPVAARESLRRGYREGNGVRGRSEGRSRSGFHWREAGLAVLVARRDVSEIE